ncbi:MAG: sel1 repeat family protein [Clostridia bacterium]|nr:sel1 repeat family protein [Clostridia bacterium]
MDYAIKTLKTRADSGDVDAMLELSKKLINGDGVKYNVSKARKYLHIAAESGDERAYLELGKLYKDIAKFSNPNIAEYWLRKAVDNGSDEASYLLGCLYYECSFGSYAYETAAKWLLQPAEHGNAEAQLLLGLSCLELEKFEECYCWLKKSAEQGNAEAQYWYAIYADIPEKEQEYWLNKSIENGYQCAYNDLGRLYIYSEECRDYSKGIEILTYAAEKGYDGCMCSLAECYFDGLGVARDGEKAFYWYKRAGFCYGRNHVGLGKCYLYGMGVKCDYKKALKYFNKHLDTDREAVYELGNCYFNGWGVEPDKDKAKSLWEQSAEYGFEKAKKALEENFK